MRDKAFKEKLAKRLVYLWCLRDTDPRKYLDYKLGHEKEDIYAMCCNDREPIEMAYNYYNSPAYATIAEQGRRYRYIADTDSIVGG